MGWDLGLNLYNRWIFICSHDFGIVPIWTMLIISSNSMSFFTRLCFQTGIHVERLSETLAFRVSERRDHVFGNKA
jgi:hypothetical protein